jgi:hypothetical protein
VPLRFEDAVVIIVQEGPDGYRLLNEAVRIWPDGRPPEQLGWPEIEIGYRSGTRHPERATIHLTERGGKPLTLEVETRGFLALNAGAGYGGDPDWSHGQWRGAGWVEGADVENLKSRGVQVLTMLSNPDQLAALYKSMADVGYFPKYTMVDASMYDTKLIAEGGSALQGNIYVNSGIVPFELADQVPATKQYLDLLQQYAKGARPKGLGVNGFSAWLLFAQSAKACGLILTRQCLIDHAAVTKDWTGGGLHGAQQPGNATQSLGSCFMLLKATPNGFVVDTTLTQPNNGLFNCDPANVFKLKGFPPS